jgi:hypothetical protein
LARETEILGENLLQCRFVHHIPHILCPNANSGRRGVNPATNRLSYGTVFLAHLNVILAQINEADCGYILDLFLFSRIFPK